MNTKQNTFNPKGPTMYNREFFRSKLGQAAIASIAAMVAFVALSTQFNAANVPPASVAYDSVMVEIA